MEIRPLQAGDSLEELTALIRAAYSQLAALGFRYWGTYQSVDDTRHRCASGTCLVAVSEGRFLGTVLLKDVFDEGDPPLYRERGTRVVSQFAILPELQGQGLGSRLLAEAERVAREDGASKVALDTAEGANHLIAFYEKRGYGLVGTVDWHDTNYVSVLMAKRLD